jgi:transposase
VGESGGWVRVVRTAACSAYTRRRNWLFTGSPRGGRAAAVAYTLIESCRIAKIDIVSYLADVLVRVATHPASRVEELLPDRWAKLVASERLVESVAQ